MHLRKDLDFYRPRDRAATAGGGGRGEATGAVASIALCTESMSPGPLHKGEVGRRKRVEK